MRPLSTLSTKLCKYGQHLDPWAEINLEKCLNFKILAPDLVGGESQTQTTVGVGGGRVEIGHGGEKI